jgi:hypothetical protein
MSHPLAHTAVPVPISKFSHVPRRADTALGALGYNRNPGKLQAIIRKIFELASARIVVPGVRVVAFPM